MPDRTPYGAGTPITVPATGGRVFRDPMTGASLGARLIDQTTRDYVLDAYGQTTGMDGTLHLVQVAIATVKRSSAMRDLGNDFSSIGVITDDIERRIDSVLTEAVAHLTAAGLIEVLGLAMFRAGTDDGLSPGQVYTRFQFRRLPDGAPQTAEFRWP